MSFVSAVYRTVAARLEPIQPAFTPEELAHFESWCYASGMRPEGPGGSAFTLEGRAYTKPIYDEHRKRIKRRTVKKKAAQLGLTIQMLYRGAWLTADLYDRCNTGFFFPTKTDVYDLHKTRFRPMIHSSSRMRKLLEFGGVDAVEVVRIGYSNMRFRGISTGTGVDSVPLDAVLFDEVRLMSLAMVERAFLRISESHYFEDGPPGIIDLNSTAGFPGLDIDFYFQRSTQHTWHVLCPNGACENHRGFIIEEAWEKCVDFERQHYICPKCGTRIEDTQRGVYIPLGPADADWEGYTFSKVLKGNAYLPEMIKAYRRMVIDGQNPQEFYNGYLAQTHRDPNAVIVTAAVFNRSTQLEPNYRWAEAEKKRGFRAIGFDQRPEEKHAIVLELREDQRVYLVHAEVVQQSSGMSEEDVLEYCAQLARRFRCDIGVVDRMPDTTFSGGLRRRFPDGYFWLAEYPSGSLPQPVVWADSEGAESNRKTQNEHRDPFVVKIDRYKHLLAALSAWKNERVILPADAFLERIQQYYRGGELVSEPILLELRRHMENIARVAIEVPERNAQSGEVMSTGRMRYLFKHLAIEPHFAHAYGYAYAGIMRRVGTTAIAGLGASPDPQESEGQVQRVVRQAKSLSKTLARTCGACKHFEAPASGALGQCMNKLVALRLNATPPVKTLKTSTNCAQFSAKEP